MIGPTTNMGLKIWDQATDQFHYTELRDNWQQVEDHDHTGAGKGKKIGATALLPASVTVANGALADGAVSTAKIQPQAVDDTLIAVGVIEQQHLSGSTTGLAAGAFSYYLNASSGSPPAYATGGRVVFKGLRFDISSWYDPATGIFTPQIAGYYRLTATLTTLNSLPVDKWIRAGIDRNGTPWQWGSTAIRTGGTASDISASAVSTIVQANGSTDYFSVLLKHNVGGTLALQYTDVTQCSFDGQLIGKL